MAVFVIITGIIQDITGFVSNVETMRMMSDYFWSFRVFNQTKQFSWTVIVMSFFAESTIISHSKMPISIQFMTED